MSNLDFYHAYLEGQKAASFLAERASQAGLLLRELESCLPNNINLNRINSTTWSIRLRSKEGKLLGFATARIYDKTYTLQYLEDIKTGSSVGDFRDLLLEMLENPKMHY